MDGGFRVVISSRFADIFRNNSTKAGLLTVLLPQADVEALWAAVEADPTTAVTVDLQAKQVTYGATTVPFDIDDYTRWRLLEGLDDVGLTERNLPDIEAFEAAARRSCRRRARSATAPPGRGRNRGSSPPPAPRPGRPAPSSCPFADGGPSRPSAFTPRISSTDGIAPPWLQTTVTPGRPVGTSSRSTADVPASGSA